MRRAVVVLVAVGGLAVLFATAAQPGHGVRHSHPRAIGYTYCIETTSSVPAIPPYQPQAATAGPCATTYVAGPGG